MTTLFDLVARSTEAALGGSTTEPSFWMPEQASTSAPGIDFIFDFVLWLSVVFFVLIVGLMLLFVLRHRAKDLGETGPPIHHNHALEFTWTIIPTILVVFIFWVGFRGFLDLSTPPANAYEIQVTGQQWQWLFTYPSGYVDGNLHVPVDRPVTLIMTSDDVIHSFFVPAFRVKRDVFPGRYSKVWFQAVEPGNYQIFCAEYCGTQHSTMLADCVVHPPGEFEQWLEKASNFLDTVSPEEGGQMLFGMRGCTQCHNADATTKIGPGLGGLFGKSRTFQDGSTAVADENYLRQSILQPQAQIVAGFDGVMPTQQGRLNDQEISALIAYIKSLP